MFGGIKLDEKAKPLIVFMVAVIGGELLVLAVCFITERAAPMEYIIVFVVVAAMVGALVVGVSAGVGTKTGWAETIAYGPVNSMVILPALRHQGRCPHKAPAAEAGDQRR